MPRTPAVYERKTRWGALDDYTATKMLEGNYKSLDGHVSDVEKQFRDEAKEGRMSEWSVEEAQKLAKDNESELLVASLGCLSKDDGTVRVLHDATHRVGLNNRCVQRDQARSPGAGEIKVTLDEGRQSRKTVISLAADFTKAHRTPRYKDVEFTRLACSVRPGRLWLNHVGTFGVSTVGYFWSREVGVPHRLQFSLLEPGAHFFSLLMADDINYQTAGAEAVFNVVVQLFFYTLAGFDIAWKKCRGGTVIRMCGLLDGLRTFQHRRFGQAGPMDETDT